MTNNDTYTILREAINTDFRGLQSPSLRKHVQRAYVARELDMEEANDLIEMISINTGFVQALQERK